MRATVNVKELARAMREVSPVVRQHGYPITQNVLVETRDGHLRLTCFTLNRPRTRFDWELRREIALGDAPECCRVREIPARVEAEGATTVPAKLLKELARELKRGDVELALEHHMVCRFRAIEVAEWPALYRNIELGDWGFLAPALEVAA